MTPANWWGGEMERRLAAVLAADVAGYSRLMGEDEEGTLRRLNAHRLGRAGETVTYVQQALRLSPRDPSLANWLSFIGRAEFYLGRDDAAIDSLLKAEVVNPRLSGIYLHLAAAYALTNRDTPARDALAQFEKLEPDTTIAKVKAETQKMSDNPTFLKQRERLYDGLRKAGMPEG